MTRFVPLAVLTVLATASAAAMPPPVEWRSAATDAVVGTYALALPDTPTCNFRLTNEAYGGSAPFAAYDLERGSGCLISLGALAGEAHTDWFWQLGPGGEIVLLDTSGRRGLSFTPHPAEPLSYVATISGKPVAIKQTEPQIRE